MILILSHRELKPNGKGVETFQRCLKAEGSTQILLAMASIENDQKWGVDLLPADPVEEWEESSECLNLFSQLIKSMVGRETESGAQKLQRNPETGAYTWILFIPGYSSNLNDSLKKAKEMEDTYNSNVILYSWPADPEGTEPARYFKARDAARLSARRLKSLLTHLEQVFTKPAREALAEDFRISMLLHSLGNKVLESLILNEEAAAQSTMFNTIIMHQPDVDAAGVMQWINKVSPQEELYITVNQHDGVLIISDIVNRIRLGLFPGDLIAHSLPKLSVIDFTHAHNVARAHWLFTDFENNIVRLICKRMIHGNASDQRINMGLESQLIYFADKFSYSFPEPELMRLRT
jgi:hypothetical protein